MTPPSDGVSAVGAPRTSPAGTAPLASSSPTWTALQALGVTLTGVLILGLVLAPDPTLALFWKLVIPLIPVSLLISPLLWRNLCPLATLNLLADRPGSVKSRGRAAVVASAVGIGLLLLLVPARRFLFNIDGHALAATIVAVAVGAVVLGAIFDAKAGFCAGICPVLPVERLYGQSPLLRVRNARCSACSACTSACPDLSPRRSAHRLLGSSRSRSAWTVTPFGAFAAAFPGFVVGYFTLSDVTVGAALSVYAHVGVWMASSWAVVAALALLPGVSAARLMPALGATAAGLYYWFAAPDLGATLGLPAAAADHLRVAVLGLVGAWLLRAWDRARPRSSLRTVPSRRDPDAHRGFGPLPSRGRPGLPRPERFS